MSQFLCPNWLPLTRMNLPSRPSATGTTGWRRATVSESGSPVESYACGLDIEDAYGKTSVEIANHVG